MQIGVNQFCFPASYDVRASMESAKEMEFDSIELCMTAGQSRKSPVGGVTDALDITTYYNRLLNIDSGERDWMELRKMADDIGIRIGSIGGIVTFSIYPMSSADSRIGQKSVDAARRMMDAARVLGADTILLIPGMLTPEQRYEEGYELAQKRLSEIAEYAPEIRIGVENVWNHMLYSPMELSRFVDETGKKNIGIYFDIANARRFGYPEQWIRTLNRRIFQFHCKDYRMSVDNINGFTNLLDGDVNYKAVMKAVREIGFDGEMVVELIPPAKLFVKNTLRYARTTLIQLISDKEDAE